MNIHVITAMLLLIFNNIFFCLQLSSSHAQSNQNNYKEIISSGFGYAYSVDWHPSGNLVVVGTKAGIVFYNENLQQENFIPTENAVQSVTWSPDGSKLAILEFESNTTIFNVADFDIISTLPWGSTIEETEIAWNNTGTQIAVLGNGYIEIWDVGSGQQVKRWNTIGTILGLSWSSNGTMIAGIAFESQTYIWDTQGNLLYTIPMGNYLTPLWSPDSNILAIHDFKNIRLWNINSQVQEGVLQGHTDNIISLAWYGDKLATGSLDNTIRIWNVNSKKVIQMFEGHLGSIRDLDWNPSGSQLVSISSDHSIRIWDVATAQVLAISFQSTSSILAIQWNEAGSYIISASQPFGVQLWAVNSDKISSNEIVGNTELVGDVAINSEGSKVAETTGLAFDDPVIRLWDLETNQLELEFEGHTARINAIDWEPSGTRIVSVSNDKTAHIWNPSTGAEILTFTGHAAPVLTVDWSPDGATIASADGAGVIKLWNPTTGAEVRTITTSEGAIHTLAWRPDGGLLATGGEDGNLYLWNPTTGDLVDTLSGHTAKVNELDWQSDTVLASASDDGTVRIWDATTVETIQILDHGGAAVLSLDWSPDGKRLATGDADGAIQIWGQRDGE